MSFPTPSSPPDLVIKNRFLGFLIWQSIPSTMIYLFSKTLISAIVNTFTHSTNSNGSTTGRNPLLVFVPSFIGFISFFTFHLSQLLFSATLSVVASPQPERSASPLELAIGIFRLLVVPGDGDVGGRLPENDSPDFRRRVKVSVSFFMFAAASAAAGFTAAVSLCGVSLIDEYDCGFWLIERVGLRGFVVGLLFGLHYVYKRRWVLEFPIIQRPPYFSFKMELPSAARRAFRLSSAAFLLSAILTEILPHPFKSKLAMQKFFTEQIIFSIGIFAVFLCWELSHHLHQVLHTKRFIFAPPKGSAAAETNPSEHLLAALEESNPTSLLRYLAYLDLYMVCENNVDPWRRAAFFEETGETYKRVIAVCLRPLEHLSSRLGEGLGNSVGTAAQISNQLLSPTDTRLDLKYLESLNNFQLYAWCSKTVASLTAGSHREDKFGVAQLSGSNAAVISTLISCLLAIETITGKKTNLQSPNQLLGPAGIRWATVNTGRADAIASAKKRSGPVNSKAYAIADVLKNSIYQVVSAFHDEMLASAKAGMLEKEWVANGKPLFGSREILVQKLRLFLDFQAT
ncbi:hypothetical protein L6164_013459 [Bauhinia variegata]|uniref:Uncharacterized protein n=1 Tax=Bauhinia variegata TaxID=167791 RepID=A0ACB9NF07_BAUVA|nr:hypothetical protein L6164_013459 [Bauhinia variegata]